MSKTFDCKYCDMSFVTDNGLQTHTLRHHADEDAASAEPQVKTKPRAETTYEAAKPPAPPPEVPELLSDEEHDTTVSVLESLVAELTGELHAAKNEIAEFRAMVQAQDVALKGIADIASVFKK